MPGGGPGGIPRPIIIIGGGGGPGGGGIDIPPIIPTP